MDENIHWRMTAIPAKFWIIDSRASFLIPPVLIHIRIWTISAMLIGLVILWLIERRGYSPEVTMRMLRLWLAGGLKVPMTIKTFNNNDSWRMGKMSEAY